MRYSYEADTEPDNGLLKTDLITAAAPMKERMGRWKLLPKMQVAIEVEGARIPVWEGSGHIEFVRTLNRYEPNLRTALQFSHL